MKVLVTGASGLIGSAIATELYRLGHTVVAVDNFSRGTVQPDCTSFVQQDIQSIEFDNDFDVIYHMGAVNGTSNFYSKPTETLVNNITCDLAMFKCATQQLHLQKFVYASTSELVHNHAIPTPETANIGFENSHDPRWSYSLPKVTVENLLVNSDLPYLIVRYFNVYGANSKSGHFVHDQIAKISSDVFEIIGADETRSYCYIDDAVKATLKLAELAKHDVVNIGNDTEITAEHAANIIARRLGKSPTWKLLPSRSASAKRRCPDLTKLKSYIPDYSPIDFQTGLEHLLDALHSN